MDPPVAVEAEQPAAAPQTAPVASPPADAGPPPSKEQPAPTINITLSTRPRSGRPHRIEVPEGAQRLEGVVVSHQEKFGFIKAASAEARYFFHVRDSDGRTSLGATVTFVIAQDLTTGKHVAYHVQTLAQRAQQARVQEERLPGSFLGTLIALPRGPAGVCVDDGVVAFTNSAGLEQQALFGAGRVATGALLQLGADVQFGLVRNLATRVFKAVDVRPADPLAVASQHLPLSGLGGSGDVLDSLPSGRQLGRVALLKKEFGFLRQLARPGDMFFHFSQLEGVPPEEIHVGDDVEFAVRRDRDGKQSAVAVRRAAPGLVVFDVVSEKELRGVVVERPAAGKPHMATSGVIGYEVPSSVVGAAAGAEGAPLPPPPPAHAKLTFAAADAQGAASLRVGDHVTFRVATNLAAARAAASASTPGAAQHAGRRAVQVAAVRCCGIVALVNADRKFGFITYEEGAAPAAEAELQPPEAEADTETEAEQENGGTNAGLTAQDRAPAPPPAASSAIATAAIEETPAVAAAVAPAAVAAAAPAVQRRIFFHFSEVAGGVTLRVGDEVAFVLSSHQKRDPATGVKERGEVHASRVKRTKEAPAVTHPEARSPGVKPDLAALLRNPNKPKLTGNLQSGEHKTQRMPKGPDGSVGFAFGRGKGLEVGGESAAPGSAPTAGFAGLSLRGILSREASSTNLSVGAAAFVPRTASSASLGGA